MTCTRCGTETTNPRFCSRSCAVAWNNHLKPKRGLKKRCVDCGEKVISWRSSRCAKCYDEYTLSTHKNKTMGEYRTMLSVEGKHASWRHAHIRRFARQWLKHLTQQPCRHCGYDKFVELCHITPVSEFPDSALLSEVNSENNVIPLCPNCHWEFDHLPRVTANSPRSADTA